METQNGKMGFLHGEKRIKGLELREQIINATIDEFQDKGLKLTMNDVAKRIHISKKTLYKVFENKEELFLAVADYTFAEIKRHEQMVLENPELDLIEKIRRLIIVLPERYKNIGLSNLYPLQDLFPDVYRKTAHYLETDWDATISLLEQGVREGKIRQMPIPIMKAMVESTIQHFMSSQVLVENGISFEQGLQEMIDIIMDGIVMR